MADNICGGSTPLKSLSAQADRDRSLHQDRRTTSGSSTGSAAFRTTALNPRTEGDFNTFLQNVPPMATPNEMAAAMRQGGHFNAPATAGVQMGHHTGPQIGLRGQQPLSFATPHVGYPAGAVPLNGSNGNSWVTEFSSLNMGPSREILHPSVGPGASIGFLPPGNGYVPIYPSTQPFTSPTHFAPPYMQSNPITTFNPYAPQHVLPAPSNGTAYSLPQPTEASVQSAKAPQPALSEAELNAQFDTFDKHEQLENDAEFKSHMNHWMAQHGPAPKSPKSIYNAKPKLREDASAELEYFARELEEMGPRRAIEIQATRSKNTTTWAGSKPEEPKNPYEVILAEQKIQREKEAAEQKKQKDQEARETPKSEEVKESKKEQDDLSRTASEILQSVSTNNNEKFKKSSFFQLMQRISSKEVVVQNGDLVDAATGTPVNEEDTALDHRQNDLTPSTSAAVAATTIADLQSTTRPQTGVLVDVAEEGKAGTTTASN